MQPSTGLYETFFKTATDAMFVFERATKTLINANAQALKDTGYRFEELNGFFIDRLFCSQGGTSAQTLCGQANGGGKECVDGLRLISKSGETIAVNVSLTPLGWGEVIYVFIVARRQNADFGVRPATESSAAWSEREDFPSIIGSSEKIHDVCRLIGSVAKSEATVLIQGESGTGKESVASAIHAHSHRHRGPFVKVNCAALTESLLESELFGHVRGAFTGAVRDRRGRFKQADGGTILLDEIGNMPPAGQAKLLRVLQEREFEPVGSSMTTSVNVRVLASTNVDLARAVEEGAFREDLYYRLNVFVIQLPQLRERKEDIPLLAKHFLDRYCRTIGKRIRAIDRDTLSLMMEHDWPGNVRELENAIEHAVIVEKDSVIVPSSLPTNLSKTRSAKGSRQASAEMGLREKLTLVEKQILLETLSRTNWIRKHAASMLQVDPRNMPYLMRKHHLKEDKPRH